MSEDAPAAAEERFTDCYFVVRDGLKLHYRDYPGSADKTDRKSVV